WGTDADQWTKAVRSARAIDIFGLSGVGEHVSERIIWRRIGHFFHRRGWSYMSGNEFAEFGSSAAASILLLIASTCDQNAEFADDAGRMFEEIVPLLGDEGLRRLSLSLATLAGFLAVDIESFTASEMKSESWRSMFYVLLLIDLAERFTPEQDCRPDSSTSMPATQAERPTQDHFVEFVSQYRNTLHKELQDRRHGPNRDAKQHLKDLVSQDTEVRKSDHGAAAYFASKLRDAGYVQRNGDPWADGTVYKWIREIRTTTK
ncbi:MAG: hypothetical protein KIT73_13845, partial [Burkholderiales bacterium]|nr:hypothetical protein [Burkholderiales bacterium]